MKEFSYRFVMLEILKVRCNILIYNIIKSTYFLMNTRKSRKYPSFFHSFIQNVQPINIQRINTAADMKEENPKKNYRN